MHCLRLRCREFALGAFLRIHHSLILEGIFGAGNFEAGIGMPLTNGLALWFLLTIYRWPPIIPIESR